MNKLNSGCVFIIWGGTGNLTYSKLIPALYSLFLNNSLAEDLYFFSIGRKPYSNTEYLNLIRNMLETSNICDDVCLERFLSHFEYFQMNFEETEKYKLLKQKIDGTALKCNQALNQIFYFAVSPKYFNTISSNMNDFEFLNNNGFNRVIFEKPFGKDLETANQFNNMLKKVFNEDEVYRIDHYLGKTMIQNILTLRFSNRLFEEIWSNIGIDRISINIFEKEGVLSRGKYYDEFGALRDMVQNHLLQIVALIAMDAPEAFIPDAILKEKLKILKSIKLFNDSDLQNSIILGQYEGYNLEDNIAFDSKTETFVQLKVQVLNEKWIGVPFYLTTGKALNEKYANIEIIFKENSSNFSLNNTDISRNKLVIKIQPDEGVELIFNSKIPGLENQIQTVKMDYCQSCNYIQRSPDAYEKLLLDVLNGDKTLFTNWDEIEASWIFIDLIQSKCNLLCNPLIIYPKYTKGPRLKDYETI